MRRHAAASVKLMAVDPLAACITNCQRGTEVASLGRRPLCRTVANQRHAVIRGYSCQLILMRRPY